MASMFSRLVRTAQAGRGSLLPLQRGGWRRTLFTTRKLPGNATLLQLQDAGASFPALGIMLASEQYPLAAYLWEKLAFRATANWSPSQMQGRLDGLVGAVQAKSQREHVLFSGAVVPAQQGALLELLWEVIQHPTVQAADLEEMQQVVAYEQARLEEKPEELLPELIYRAAYGGRDGGSLLDFGGEEALQTLKPSDLLSQWKAMAQQPLIIAAAGQEPLDLNLETGGESAGISFSPSSKPLSYVGGELRYERDEMPLVHLAMALPAPAAGHSDSYAMAILQMLLGGGGSFSAGGPGKGMYSRLYTQVLNRLHWCECARVLHHSHRTHSLFGIYGAALPSHGRELALTLRDQLWQLTAPLGTAELARARQQVCSALLMGYESRLVQVEDVGTQWLQTGHYTSVRDMVERVMGVTTEDITRVASQMLKQPLSLVVMGPSSLRRIPTLL